MHTSISDEKLTEWNRRGLIPGPAEPLSAFLQRASVQDVAASLLPQKALDSVRGLYDISPEWVALDYSDKGLGPWHGGALLLEEAAGVRAASIQVRAALKKGSLAFGLYRKEELVAHELVHAGRMGFDEPKYEELFAYRTSRLKYRRFLGPLIGSSWELIVFMITSLLPLLSELVGWTITSWLFALPFTLLGIGITRLAWRRLVLRRCLRKLEKISGSKEGAWAMVYRLSDFEITRFSGFSMGQIEQYIASRTDLRWRMISLCYC